MIKGCGNPDCENNKKKIRIKDSDNYCSICGQGLVRVCKKCYTVINDCDGPLCERCKAEKDDKREAAIEAGGKVVGAVIAVGAFVVEGIRKTRK